MGNTQKPKKVPHRHSIERYRSEAKGEPFVLYLDGDETIEVPRPTGDQMFEAEDALTAKGAIRAMCPEQAEQIIDAVGPEDAAVMRAVIVDMQEHFGLGE